MPKSSSIHDVNIFIPMKSGANANTLYVSIVSVFIIFSLIVYLKPELFLSIFGYSFRKYYFVRFVLGLSFYHVKSAIAIGLFFFMLVLVVRRSNIQKITDLDKKEKFKTVWATGSRSHYWHNLLLVQLLEGASYCELLVLMVLLW